MSQAVLDAFLAQLQQSGVTANAQTGGSGGMGGFQQEFSTAMRPYEHLHLSGKRLSEESVAAFIEIMKKKPSAITMDGRRAYLQAKSYLEVVEGGMAPYLPSISKLSPDCKLDVVEQIHSLLYDAMVTHGYCCRAGELADDLDNWSKMVPATQARLLALSAVGDYMRGRAAMSDKHKQYVRAVKLFKTAVKTANRVKNTSAAVPGLIQLCWAHSAECFDFAKQPAGYDVCLRKALELLPSAIDRRGIFVLSMLNRIKAKKSDPLYYQELLPSWLEAAQADPTGRALRRVGWYFNGSSYCKLKCVRETIAVGDHPCEKCYRNKFAVTGNYTFPVEPEEKLLAGRILITEDNANELFYFHAEQAFRLEAFEEGPLDAIKREHARWALRCAEVVEPYNPNVARIQNALAMLRGLVAGDDNLLRAYLAGLQSFMTSSNLGMLASERSFISAHFDRAKVMQAETMYLEDKNCFNDCNNDKEIIALVTKTAAL